MLRNENTNNVLSKNFSTSHVLLEYFFFIFVGFLCIKLQFRTDKESFTEMEMEFIFYSILLFTLQQIVILKFYVEFIIIKTMNNEKKNYDIRESAVRYDSY